VVFAPTGRCGHYDVPASGEDFAPTTFNGVHVCYVAAPAAVRRHGHLAPGDNEKPSGVQQVTASECPEISLEEEMAGSIQART
jgi:hypothetical protein